MKRWFIKIVETATNKNPGFRAGVQHEYWYGVREELISALPIDLVPSPEMVTMKIKEYGFKTKAAATRAFNAHRSRINQPMFDDGYWTCEVSLEEVNIDGYC